MVNHFDERGEVVGDNDFFEHSPDDQPNPLGDLLVCYDSFLCELWEEVLSPFDRAGHQLREETNVREELQQVFGWRYLFSVHVNCVAHALESVERNSDGQNEVPCSWFGVDSELGEAGYNRIDEEPAILEEAEHAEVHDDAHGQPPFAVLLVVRVVDENGSREVNDAGERKQRHKPPVPPAVKNVAGNNYQCVASPQITAYHVVQQSEGAEKEQECVRIEQHF